MTCSLFKRVQVKYTFHIIRVICRNRNIVILAEYKAYRKKLNSDIRMTELLELARQDKTWKKTTCVPPHFVLFCKRSEVPSGRTNSLEQPHWPDTRAAKTYYSNLFESCNSQNEVLWKKLFDMLSPGNGLRSADKLHVFGIELSFFFFYCDSVPFGIKK